MEKLQRFHENFRWKTEKSSKLPEDAQPQEKAKANGDIAPATSGLPLKIETDHGDSKAPELSSEVHDLKLNETKANEKFHMKTNREDASQGK